MSKRQLQNKKKSSASSSNSSSKLSSAAAFTIFLLAIMAVIGALTGFIGYTFGRTSLKGITQPDLNPFLNSIGDISENPRRGLSFVKEDELIKKVKVETNSPSGQSAKKPDASSNGQAKANDPKKDEPQKADGSFPIRLESEKVKLDIRSLVQESDEIVLNIAMSNGRDEPVQFIYTFLDVSDNKGFSLASEVLGIPDTLDAKSETHVGRIRVLDTPPGAATRLSLKLTDYPDQKINLEIKDIPVPKNE